MDLDSRVTRCSFFPTDLGHVVDEVEELEQERVDAAVVGVLGVGTDRVQHRHVRPQVGVPVQRRPQRPWPEEAVAGLMLARAQIGLPMDESLRAAQRYVGLTADEVKAAFARQIRTDNLVQVVRGPAPK